MGSLIHCPNSRDGSKFWVKHYLIYCSPMLLVILRADLVNCTVGSQLILSKKWRTQLFLNLCTLRGCRFVQFIFVPISLVWRQRQLYGAYIESHQYPFKVSNISWPKQIFGVLYEVLNLNSMVCTVILIGTKTNDRASLYLQRSIRRGIIENILTQVHYCYPCWRQCLYL